MKKETSNKILLGLVAFIFLTSILSQIILAADTIPGTTDPEVIKETSKTAVMTIAAPFMAVIEAFLEIVFGPQWLNATRLFFYVLLILIMYSIVPLIIGENRSKWLTFLISFSIATLSIMAIPPELLDTLITNYGAMGAAMLTIIPFAIILLFSIRVQNAMLARVVWIFYAVYYFALYIYKIITISTTGTWTAGQYTLYGFAIIGGIAMFFGIGKIRSILIYGQMDALKETGDELIKSQALLGQLDKKRLKRVYGPQ